MVGQFAMPNAYRHPVDRPGRPAAGGGGRERTSRSACGELAEATDLPKSTVSRLVAALERHALVQRDGARGPLRPGPVLMRLARRGVGDRDLVDLARRSLRRLAEASGETINLAVPTPLGVEHLSQVDSRHFLGSTNWIGRRVPHTAPRSARSSWPSAPSA